MLITAPPNPQTLETPKLTNLAPTRLTRATNLLIRDSLFFLLIFLLVAAFALLISLVNQDGQLDKEIGNLFPPLTRILSALIGVAFAALRVWFWWVDRRDELAAR